MVAVAGQRTETSPARNASRQGFRPDVQGLRAVAVGVVLIYHAGVPFLPGGYIGVDVFFVISGFLITGLLLKELDQTGRISLSGFYARRARRILPAAVTVLAVTAALTLLFLPRTRWEGIGAETIAAGLFAVNWLLAGSEADYLQEGAAASPLQHYWTLAVEEQFYLIWPLLLVGAALLARRRPGTAGASRLRVLVIAAVLLLSVPSLAYSIYYTAADPGPAYFVTTTRLYELGIGAATAVFATRLAGIPRRVAVILGWAGLAGILAAAVFYTADTAFPGAAALLPTLGAAAVIVAGLNGRDRSGAGRLLSLRPMTWAGDISYSWYLWHWPLVVIATELAGGLTVPAGLAVVVLSAVPAWLSYRYLERPYLRWRLVKPNGRALRAGGAGMAVAALAGVLLVTVPSPVTPGPTATITTVQDEDGTQRTVEVYGAEALAVDPSVGRVENAGGFMPAAEDATEDYQRNPQQGCHIHGKGSEPRACVYGDPGAEYTVALVGDSHAAHWVPALKRVAGERGLRLESYTKSACPLSTVVVRDTADGTPNTDCRHWGENVMSHLQQSQPDLVLVTSSRHSKPDGGRYAHGAAAAWQRLQDAGLRVGVVLDVPRPDIDVPECVVGAAGDVGNVGEAGAPGALAECAVPRDEALAKSGRSEQEVALAQVDGIPAVDLAPKICPEEQCSPVIGGVLLYRDSHHLTATYAATLAPDLDQALVDEGLLDGAGGD
ncbi:acyltransferase family protein [Citricoccus sp. NPDC055426]|uniref:acyltransferase family protein n=1 Tax=Citricoccus sp. NPDC055426 TaxID=3155536 RepID=UPI00342A6D9F